MPAAQHDDFEIPVSSLVAPDQVPRVPAAELDDAVALRLQLARDLATLQHVGADGIEDAGVYRRLAALSDHLAAEAEAIAEARATKVHR